MTAVCCSAASLSLLPDLSSQPLQPGKTRFLCARGSQASWAIFTPRVSTLEIYFLSQRGILLLWLFTLETPTASPPPGSSYWNAPHRGGDNAAAGPEPQGWLPGSGIHKQVERQAQGTQQESETLSGSAMCTWGSPGSSVSQALVSSLPHVR